MTDFSPGVLKSEDGGITWSRIGSNLRTELISAVWFPTLDQGWAIGVSHAEERAEPVIMNTQDGGQSWRIQKRLRDGVCQLLDVWFLDVTHGWVTGSCDNEGLILTTRDAGANWKIVYQGAEFTPEIRRVRFADSRTGWAVGQWAILFTTDGGTTWRRQYKDAKAVALNDLTILSSNEAWAAGGWGFLLHTKNGGINWLRSPLPSETIHSFVCSVRFADRKLGWVCGAKGLVLSTTDGGESWQREHPAVDSVLTDIAVTSSHVFIPTDLSRLLVRSR